MTSSRPTVVLVALGIATSCLVAAPQQSATSEVDAMLRRPVWSRLRSSLPRAKSMRCCARRGKRLPVSKKQAGKRTILGILSRSGSRRSGRTGRSLQALPTLLRAPVKRCICWSTPTASQRCKLGRIKLQPLIARGRVWPRSSSKPGRYKRISNISFTG